MKYLLLSLPLALMACVKPDCVVYVNGKPVYNQCYQNDNDRDGKNYSPPADDNGSNSIEDDNGNNSIEDNNGNKSKDHSNDSNGDNSDEGDE